MRMRIIEKTGSMEYDLKSGTRKIRIEITVPKELQLSWNELLGEIKDCAMSCVQELITDNKIAVLGSRALEIEKEIGNR